MGKTVPFKRDAKCDSCGNPGAYDFYGDYICGECFKTLMDDEPEETEK